ncbi:MAG TPA: thioredoxin family protein [Rhodocyclaceae bacterium]|nr:thioredoxin family protein [Rhodocyclaceae bacterium]
MKPLKIVAVLLVTWFATLALCAEARDSATGFDASANPAADVARAVQQAKATHRKVLVIAGGEWCPWCRALDAFITNDADARSALDRAFVTVHVYYGEKNRNEAFFATMPRAKGYPHFWILAWNGELIESVDTSIIEDGKSGYDKEKFLRFVAEYGGT